VVILRYHSVHKRSSTAISYKTRTLRWYLIAGHCTLFKLWGTKCKNIRAANKIKYVESAWVTTEPDLLVFCSVPIYENIKHTNKDFITKAVLLTSCKHGQKFQLNCALLWFSNMKQTAGWKLPTLIQNAMLNQYF
jgi:hypothetical protein